MEYLNGEIWKWVCGYEGFYKVSNMGRIMSIDRKVKYKDGRERMHYGKISIGNKDKNGYLLYGFSVNRNVKHLKVHRVVLASFIGYNLNKQECNHINGIKNDNRLENLEWVTKSENLKHAIKIGLSNPEKNLVRYSGIYHYNSKVLIKIDDNGNEIKRYFPMKSINMDGHSICVVKKQMLKGRKYKGYYYKIADNET